MAPGFSDDEVLVDGLPVGSMFGFMWNMISKFSVCGLKKNKLRIKLFSYPT